jgi:hypothetical protein
VSALPAGASFQVVFPSHTTQSATSCTLKVGSNDSSKPIECVMLQGNVLSFLGSGLPRDA